MGADLSCATGHLEAKLHRQRRVQRNPPHFPFLVFDINSATQAIPSSGLGAAQMTATVEAYAEGPRWQMPRAYEKDVGTGFSMARS
ncbi:hypothetical protein E2562_010569 [Oryza meyeriana var. granulata]|uniref:Uncharacterized protein n=1 Tax=Oryza meyeriana var. granulata TaxID=110450 RepID=A0A6G1BV13_9ORYZ|nr:hypothetical protein E2562_010569 [Oryza meyeriana var. granulata]